MFRGPLPDKLPASDPGQFFVPGPNPIPGAVTAATKNPHRLLAGRTPTEKSWMFRSDAAVDPAIQRQDYPLTPIQAEQLPVEPIYIITGGYSSPMMHYSRGWEQSFVPAAGRRPALAATAPVIISVAPIKYDLRSAVQASTKRKMLRAKAPKAKG